MTKASGEMMQSTMEGSSSLEIPNNAKARTKAPVFVLGCPRSGTTMLYHMLLSTGDFAVFRSESNVFNLLVPHFGNLRSAENRKKLMQVWLRSKMFRVSGLEKEQIQPKIMAECHTGGDFLRIVMEEMARVQGVSRWAESTPDHLLHIPEIMEQVPDAIIVHIIRDGRDVTLSYVKQRWARPFPWDRGLELAVAGLYWEWIVRQGQSRGKKLGPSRYVEVRFEDLVASPAGTLNRLSSFVGQELDYERIRRSGVGSVGAPNSSFPETGSGTFNPVGRWKEQMSTQELVLLEALTGGFLKELGYPLVHEEPELSLTAARLRATYLPWFDIKQWLKTKTPLGRRVRLGPLEIQ